MLVMMIVLSLVIRLGMPSRIEAGAEYEGAADWVATVSRFPRGLQILRLQGAVFPVELSIQMTAHFGVMPDGFQIIDSEQHHPLYGLTAEAETFSFDF